MAGRDSQLKGGSKINIRSISIITSFLRHGNGVTVRALFLSDSEPIARVDAASVSSGV